jgi:hypothetical protein
MCKILPDASRLGFTGTPLFERDNITVKTFGEYVSVYDFQRAVEDGNTVPLYYENRGEKLKIENPEKYYAQKTKARRNYRKNHSEKAKAQSLFNEAVRAGKIIKPDYCWLCDKKCELEAHHFDYSKPYDVIWVCSECHHKVHKNIRLIRSYYQNKSVSNSYE